MGKEDNNDRDSGTLEEKKVEEKKVEEIENPFDKAIEELEAVEAEIAEIAEITDASSYLSKLAGAEQAYRIIKTAFNQGLQEIGHRVSISTLSSAFSVDQDDIIDIIREFIVKEGTQSSGAPLYCLKQSIVDYLTELKEKASEFSEKDIHSILLQNDESGKIKDLTSKTTLFDAYVRTPSELKLIQLTIELSSGVEELPLNYGETIEHILERITAEKSLKEKYLKQSLL